ncbi:2-dehydro-3-deoxyphosphogluconate aldolase/4-hydroxy-2-oxoglutarate aldolase [Coriobacterium glomerans PW2]|uniref:2-dehydro-3-deoxy-phosphogluconate aldolase n=1 Tax=Coriobacterium glomerans (strain ATCC 49209 / DSM 20642 / JCM 10262 / PW2) TaxID=700015 RepID=F2NBG0_CORGP|nr:bifunctional 4-hydroxy-2-oxoglutarate aldolase/2-dehydro-3-deoxy-phosphogluconate aldolase [Coriobacterium glomerans]AEB06696.1 2-dehydro-3-deoxyphosphogluconate aldolase/4-hydroxy-2-oxoglutarate aldolase [Coriobacterium glomerans PW2]
MFETFYKDLEALGIVPVIVLENERSAAPMADALMAAGMAAAEVTFRTDAAAASIRAMREAQPEMIVGAGTVISVEQVDAAVASGAAFIVAPNLDVEVVKACIERNVPVLPGAVTPTEVGAARKLGLTVTKFFPAAQYGGLATIRALSAPFTGHRFIPTGGVSMGNIKEYLAAPEVIACGGTWMVAPELIGAGDFAQVTERAAEAMAALRSVRG